MNVLIFLAVNKNSGAGVLFRESYTGVKVASGELIVGECMWSTVVPKLLRSGVIDLDRSQYERSKTAYRKASTGYVDASTTYTLGAETTTAAFTLFEEMGSDVAYLGRDFLKCC